MTYPNNPEYDDMFYPDTCPCEVRIHGIALECPEDDSCKEAIICAECEEYIGCGSDTDEELNERSIYLEKDGFRICHKCNEIEVEVRQW